MTSTPPEPRVAREPADIRDGEFLARYLEQFQAMLRDSAAWIPDLVRVKELVSAASRDGKKVVLVGNGGSAAIASHVAVDLTKNARIRAVNFNEADLITCLANDYGYERWMEQAVELYGDAGDVLIAISSSGKSANVLRACEAARRASFAAVVTLSGFAPDNPLRRLGDVNFWADSSAYNLVETLHQLWLLALVDLVIGRAEYPA
ncbi:MAG: SIS domain-containing protein [Candidatus Omnitrophica bacterium]|nr:SIS domain-containing protein [Candidatus Omnitrophota bacterium]